MSEPGPRKKARVEKEADDVFGDGLDPATDPDLKEDLLEEADFIEDIAIPPEVAFRLVKATQEAHRGVPVEPETRLSLLNHAWGAQVEAYVRIRGRKFWRGGVELTLARISLFVSPRWKLLTSLSWPVAREILDLYANMEPRLWEGGFPHALFLSPAPASEILGRESFRDTVFTRHALAPFFPVWSEKEKDLLDLQADPDAFKSVDASAYVDPLFLFVFARSVPPYPNPIWQHGGFRLNQKSEEGRKKEDRYWPRAFIEIDPPRGLISPYVFLEDTSDTLSALSIGLRREEEEEEEESRKRKQLGFDLPVVDYRTYHYAPSPVLTLGVPDRIQVAGLNTAAGPLLLHGFVTTWKTLVNFEESGILERSIVEWQRWVCVSRATVVTLPGLMDSSISETVGDAHELTLPPYNYGLTSRLVGDVEVGKEGLLMFPMPWYIAFHKRVEATGDEFTRDWAFSPGPYDFDLEPDDATLYLLDTTAINARQPYEMIFIADAVSTEDLESLSMVQVPSTKRAKGRAIF